MKSTFVIVILFLLSLQSIAETELNLCDEKIYGKLGNEIARNLSIYKGGGAQEPDCSRIPKEKLEETKALVIGTSAIPVGAFHRLNLARLERMTLVLDQIASEGFFNGLGNLDTLEMKVRKNVDLKPGMFIGLTRLNHMRIWAEGHLSLLKGVFLGLSKLNSLRIENSDQLQISEDGLEGLEGLASLNFIETDISELPENVFGNLNDLESLVITQNKLSSKWWSISNQRNENPFSGLYKLRRLDLSFSNNGYVPFPKNFLSDLRSLEILRLERANIMSISPGDLGAVGRLKELNLSGNWFENIEPNTFRGLRHLKRLDLSKSRIAHIDRSILSGLNELEELNLRNCEIPEIVPGTLNQLPNLVLLMLGENRIHKIEAHTFSGLNKLEVLDLSKNWTQLVEGNGFADMPNLTDLTISLPLEADKLDKSRSKLGLGKKVKIWNSPYFGG